MLNRVIPLLMMPMINTPTRVPPNRSFTACQACAAKEYRGDNVHLVSCPCSGHGGPGQPHENYTRQTGYQPAEQEYDVHIPVDVDADRLATGFPPIA